MFGRIFIGHNIIYIVPYSSIKVHYIYFPQNFPANSDSPNKHQLPLELPAMQIHCTSDRWTTVRVKGAKEGALENTTAKRAAINKWTGGLDMPYLCIYIYYNIRIYTYIYICMSSHFDTTLKTVTSAMKIAFGSQRALKNRVQCWQ